MVVHRAAKKTVSHVTIWNLIITMICSRLAYAVERAGIPLRGHWNREMGARNPATAGSS
jgi:hypothetical protein